MRGGVGEEDVNTLQQLGFNDVQIQYLLQNHPDMDIVFLQNSINGVPDNMFFPEPQTPVQIIQTLQAIDADIDNVDESLNTTREAISQYSNNSLNNSGFSNISSIEGNSDNEISGISFNSDADTTSESIGGKRRTLARQTKRKTKKSKKTRKHRKKRQYGGVNLIDMTTTEEFSPVSYIERNEEHQRTMVTPF